MKIHDVEYEHRREELKTENHDITGGMV